MKIHAEHIWTGSGAAFCGWIEIADGRVAKVREEPAGRWRVAGEDRVFPASVVVPGLVNAHVHLDLTFAPQGETLEGPFPEWLLGVRDRRLAAGEDGLRGAAQDGVALSLAGGATTVVDYDATGASLAALAASPLRRVALREVIGFSAGSERLPELRGFLTSGGSPGQEIRGLAPHAPYTVHERLLEGAVRLAEAAGAPWSMHVAEQPSEDEFLRHGSGEYARFFALVGLAVADFARPGTTAVRHLDARDLLRGHPLLVHGNYLDDIEIEILARRGASVVFCPRSHRWFGHDPHPLPRLLAAGVTVALGTDGMISNGSLAMLDELREVRRVFPELPAPRILELATAMPHRALGGRLGSGLLAPGEPADLAIFDLRGAPRADPLEELVGGAGRTAAVFIAGEPALDLPPA